MALDATPAARPSETREIHTRLLKCALAIEESRAYWSHIGDIDPATPRAADHLAFDDYWFGAKSEARVGVLLTNLRARYDAFPAALAALMSWRDMSPEIRKLICHWHLQLADPLYRQFAATYLTQRREGARPEVYRHSVITWVTETCPDRWTITTRTQFASRLLSCALGAGLVKGKRDPRPLTVPRVPDDALAYLLHLLREIDFDGTYADNPYLASLGLTGGVLADRLRTLPCITYRRIGDVHDFEWQYPSLAAWAAATVHAGDAA